MAWDLCMQASGQSQAFRLTQFFADPELRSRVFGCARFAAAATELGPHSEHVGPALVLLSRLQRPPHEVLAWFLSPGCLVRRHVKRLYWLPSPGGSTEGQEGGAGDEAAAAKAADAAGNADGALEATTAGLQHRASGKGAGASQAQPAAAQATADQPGTGRGDRVESEEAMPGSRGVVLTSREELLTDIVSQGPQPNKVLRLQCNPKNLEKFLTDKLPEAFQLHPSSFTHVLEAIEADGWLRWSIVPAEWLYRQSSEEQQVLPDSVAHAVNKLAEAVAVSGITLGGRLRAAIDLGAAPGAWSCYLASISDLVIAVDPAQLHSLALKDNVVHVCKKAEDALPDIERLLSGLRADVLTCDMNMHPGSSSQAILTLLPFLKPGGTLVLTLKFMGPGRDRSKTEAFLRERFEGVLVGGRMLQLLANTICEQTWVATKCTDSN